MLKLNGNIVEIYKFPDGTPRMALDVENLEKHEKNGMLCFEIEWLYEKNEELFFLMLIKRHLETYFSHAAYELYLPYIPNARMDRVKNSDEVFTLKYFCEFVNGLDFSKVYVLDAHSDVSAALLNRCVNENPKPYIQEVIKQLPEGIVLYFPDAGAAKRYRDLFTELPYCYGEKKRDWRSGRITGLEIKTNGIDLGGKEVLMIDDIIAYGGSLYYSALELKKAGVKKIYAYATHTENSILDREKGTLRKALEDGTVEKVFTTNSLYTGKHEKIAVMEVNKHGSYDGITVK